MWKDTTVAYIPTIDDIVSLTVAVFFSVLICMHYTSLFLPLSVSVKGSILCLCFKSFLYTVCSMYCLSVSHTICLAVSLLTIFHSSWSPASSSTHKTWHVTAYLYYYTLKKYVCMCVWVCAHTCAAMFHLIKAPSRHIGQIDQLVCQLSWQISPSVSLFLLPAPPTPFLFSTLLFSVYLIYVDNEKSKQGWGKTSLVIIGVVFLIYIFCFFTVGCILEIPHSPTGRWPPAHFDWRDLAWHWLLTAPWMIPCCGEWWAACEASSFCYLSCTYCLDTPYH